MRRLILVLLFTLAAAPQARAAAVIRDAGIERALREIAAPVTAAAGLGAGRMNFIVLKDRRLNAVVLGPRTVAITSGLLLRLESVEEVQAVFAHEAAHIANGHISRRMSNADAARGRAAAGLIAGAATVVGGAHPAMLGVAIGGASAAGRAFLGHTRAEEAAADQAALRYLARAGIDPAAMIRVMETFRGQEALSEAHQDPYVRTHPATGERVRTLRIRVAAMEPVEAETPARAAYWHARLRAKLGAHLGGPARALGDLDSDDRGEIATLVRAIAHHRLPNPDQAIRNAENLTRIRPKDPYYAELLGQILLENRRPDEAVSAYRRAASLGPGEPLIRGGLGRALLAAGRPEEALVELDEARGRGGAGPRMLRDLAVAYSRTGQNGMASTVTAERYALLGKPMDAATNARRAMGLLPTGSPGWLRAEDVLFAAERALK